jgi:hypothetical protein
MRKSLVVIARGYARTPRLYVRVWRDRQFNVFRVESCDDSGIE